MRTFAGLLVMLLLVAVPAVAQTDERAGDAASDRPATGELDRLKGATLEEIDRRIGTLDRLVSAVETADRLTPPHRDALQIQLSAARGRLTELRDAVSDADTLVVLGALVPRIVSDYWVFALIVPKVHEVIAADALVSVAGELQEAQNQIGAVLERAAAAGIDVDAAAAALDLARLSVVEARALAVEVPGAVLPITADQMPAAGDTLVGAARTLGSAFELLSESANATRTTVVELRTALDQADT